MFEACRSPAASCSGVRLLALLSSASSFPERRLFSDSTFLHRGWHPEQKTKSATAFGGQTRGRLSRTGLCTARARLLVALHARSPFHPSLPALIFLHTRTTRGTERLLRSDVLRAALLTLDPTCVSHSPVHGASTPVLCTSRRRRKQDSTLARRFRPSLALRSCLGEPSHRRRTALPDSCVAHRLLTESKPLHPHHGACTAAVATCSDTAETANKGKRVAEIGRGDDGSNTRVILACARHRTAQVTARCFLNGVPREPVLCTHHRGKSLSRVARSHATKAQAHLCVRYTHPREAAERFWKTGREVRAATEGFGTHLPQQRQRKKNITSSLFSFCFV